MYDHKAVEKEILEFWEKNQIYEKVKNSRKKGENYYFCDGPPYATGQIHPGTGWNKCAKDAICRFWRGRGYNVRVQPGFDTHGLPIEVKVERELKIKNKQEIEKYGIGKFIEECKDFATKYIGVMSNQFKSFGVWMDWDNPYITYKDAYIESSWAIIARANELGLLTEGVYVLPYCHRCETTMANYELEYGEETDPSIFVKFRIKDRDNEFLIVWTTTPWTLTSNMAVMVHPNLPYLRVKVGNEVWVVAKERMDYLLELTGEAGTVLEEFIGKKLEKVEYEHPFQDKIRKEANRRVVLSDEYVTLEEGSGLVHTAPGHGPEDFIIGKRFGIEPFCPVDAQGRYTEEAGELAGKNVRAANPEIIKLLEEMGLLVHESRIKHRYPHCWRCKNPLIFLTTKQWFIEVSKLKEKMQEEIDHTAWQPEFARNRFRDFVRDAPDWCISRQRYWGIPLPIWKCASKDCGGMKVLSDKKELGEIKELHRPYIDEKSFKCPECGGEMKRVPDVLDVWFDSGNAVWASLSKKERESYGQADCILEGQDQIRGWFYSLLGSGVVKDGKCPYKRVIMHGFFVDEKGEKMSKSVGNFVPVEDILEKYGADSFRLWGLSNTIWDEQKFNWVSLKEAHGVLDVLYNLYVYLTRFYPEEKIKDTELKVEDRWLLSRLNNTRKEFNAAFERYEMNDAAKALKLFLVEDLSKFYMKVAKERISKGEGEGALFAIYASVLGVLKMLSVVSPFLPEFVYQKFFRNFEKEESVSLYPLAEMREGEIDPALEKQFEHIRELIPAFLELRQEKKIKLRWPLSEAYLQSESQDHIDSVNTLAPILARLINVKSVSAGSEPQRFASSDVPEGKVCLDCEMSEELYSEAMTNEIARRVQMLRKGLGLVEKDRVSVVMDLEDEIKAIVEKNKKEIMASTNTKSIDFADLEGDKKAKSWEVDGRIVKIKAEKA
ncbi:isoleucine--tRNA ligase [Candidatus Micrarchaeota archaeon]|nr:isoleucine--tRNA ligase [Candidatus Micrarchaeota archaeon]MBD3417516.1 isoleucine--tRNA ligase [Candidatus Micrarchaeota archaeon]